jgi:tetratricopeptide (TPR) repeat protein
VTNLVEISVRFSVTGSSGLTGSLVATEELRGVESDKPIPINTFDEFKKCPMPERAEIGDINNIFRDALGKREGNRVIGEIERVCYEKKERDPNVNIDGWKFFVIWILREAFNGRNHFCKNMLQEFLFSNEISENFLGHHWRIILDTVFKNAFDISKPHFRKPSRRKDTWFFSKEIVEKYSHKAKGEEDLTDELLRQALNCKYEKRYDKAKEFYVKLAEHYHKEFLRNRRVVHPVPSHLPGYPPIDYGAFEYRYEREETKKYYIKAFELEPSSDDVFHSILNLSQTVQHSSEQDYRSIPNIDFVIDFMDDILMMELETEQTAVDAYGSRVAMFLKNFVELSPDVNRHCVYEFAYFCDEYIGSFPEKEWDGYYDKVLSWVSSILKNVQPDIEDYLIFANIHAHYLGLHREYFGPTHHNDVNSDNYRVLTQCFKSRNYEEVIENAQACFDAEEAETDDFLFILFCGAHQALGNLSIASEMLKMFEQYSPNSKIICKLIKARFPALTGPPPDKDKPFPPLGTFEKSC